MAARARPNRNATSRTGRIWVGLQQIAVTQSADVPNVGAPLAPTGLSGTIGAGRLATIAWTPPAAGPAPSHYQVEVGSVTGDRDWLIASAGLLTTVTGGPLPTGRHHVRVRGVNASGAGPASNELLLIVPGPPPTPINLRVSWVSPVTANVTWDAAPGSYILEAGRLPGSSDVGSLVTAIPQVSIPRSLLENGVYYLRVKAVNVVGESAPTADVPLGVGVCNAAPSEPQLSASGNLQTLSAVMTTASPQFVDRFRLVVGTTSGGSEIGSLETANTSIQGTLPAGTYYVRAYALNTCGISVPSTEQTVTIQ